MGSLVGRRRRSLLPHLRPFLLPAAFLLLVQVLAGGASGVGGGAPYPPASTQPSLSVAIAANLTQGAVPLLVDFQATVSGAGTSALLNWSFGDNTSYRNTTAINVAHYYSHVGVYNVSVETAWSSSTATNSIKIIVEPSPLRVTLAALPLTKSPLTVVFHANVTGGTGTYSSLQWEFGDGRTGSGADQLETYLNAGTYLANFTVTDSDGAVVTRNVTLHLTLPPTNATVGPTLGSIVLSYLPWAIAIIAVIVAIFSARRPPRRSWPQGPEAASGGASGPSPEEGGDEGSAPKGTHAPSTSIVEQAPSPAPLPLPKVSAAEVSTPVEGASATTEGSQVSSLGPSDLAPEPTTIPPVEVTAPPSEPSAPSTTAEPVPPSQEKPERPPVVPRETLRLSFRLVVHIAAQGALGSHEVAPASLTQAGMAQAMGAKQNTIATILKRLEVAGVLTSDVRHVKGAPRRMKVYRLTTRGEALARDIRSRRSERGSHTLRGPRPDEPGEA
ncbi:MAG: PKD domain-containing protein [Euryarchaeota archaeon]|nr:PKD domain-containing protein [Euryarchaeota archaeon]